MKFVRSGLTAALVTLTFAACTYSKNEQTVVTVDGAVQAEVVHTERKVLEVGVIGHGHVGVPVPAVGERTDCELRIKKPVRYSLPLKGDCASSLLMADPSGARVAFSTGETGRRSWGVIYFGGAGRVYLSPQGFPDPLDWAHVPTLDAALLDLFRHAMKEEISMWRHRLSGGVIDPAWGDDLVAEALAIGGEPRLEALLAATVGAPADNETRCEKKVEPLWRRALARLSAEARGRVLGKLGEAFRAQASEDVDTRAMMNLDLDAPSWDATLLALARRRTAAPPDAFAIALRRLARTHAKDAASIGCDYLTRWDMSRETALQLTIDARGAAALLAVAHDKRRCAAVAKVVAAAEEAFGNGFCTESAWYCPASADIHVPNGGVCARAEHEARVAAEIARPLADVRRRVRCIEHAFTPMLIAALHAQGPLPPEVILRLERQTYARDVPPDAPACQGMQQDAGAACAPTWTLLPNRAMCTNARSANVYDAFAIVFDDQRRTMTFGPAAH